MVPDPLVGGGINGIRLEPPGANYGLDVGDNVTWDPSVTCKI